MLLGEIGQQVEPRLAGPRETHPGGRTHTTRAAGVSFARAREARLDLLADLAEEHLDLDALLELARSGAPELPLLPPGADR